MPLPPGPRLPAALQMMEWAYRPVRLLEECARRYGDAFTLRLPTQPPIVMLTSPADIRDVFTGPPDVLLAGEANQILEPLLGARSILLLDGARHLRQRRLLLPPFHGERMKAYAQLMRDVTLRSLSQWPLDNDFELHPFLQEITLQVILQAVFGLTEGAQMNELRALLLEFLQPPPFVLAFLPALRIDMPLSPFRTFLRRKERVHRALLLLIAGRRAELASLARTDVLSLLLAARDEDGQPLTDEELRDELLTLLVAGHETTATALSWAFVELLASPEAAGRLDEELKQEHQALEDPLRFARLPYLEAVIKETLRLRPIIPFVGRVLQRPQRIGAHELPAGAMAAPCIFLAQRRADLFEEPLRFRPERFLPGASAKVDSNSWLPYGGGVRRCIGMAFANHEMAIVLGTVLSSARLQLAKKDARVVRRSITFAPSTGACVRLRERPAIHEMRNAI